MPNPNNGGGNRGNRPAQRPPAVSGAAPGKPKRKKKKRNPVLAMIGKSLLTVFMVMVITGSIVSVVMMAFVLQLVNTGENLDISRENLQSADGLNFTSKIVATNYETKEEYVYQKFYGAENSEYVTLDQVPETLKNAIVAIEDKRFYEHAGVDWKRTIKVALDYVLRPGSSVQGGSTIDQQVVKNFTGKKEIKADRKVQEIFTALNLEKNYTKTDILEAYINIIPLGNNTRGVLTASRLYFGKEPKDLTLAECATIAGITKNPSKYAPTEQGDEPQKRRNWVLEEMYSQGYITLEEKNAAQAEPVVAKDTSLTSGETGSKVQNWAVDAIQEEVIRDLMQEKGITRGAASNLLLTGGYTVYTTIDNRAQDILEKKYAADPITNPIFKSIQLKADEKPFNSAMVIMSNDGSVRALVGNTGPKTGSRIYSNATAGKRHPGSTIKPLASYGLGIDRNLITYSTIFEDKVLDINGWSPQNYYTGVRGRMTANAALSMSCNTVAVQVQQLVGPKNSFAFLRDKVGISTLVDSRESLDGKIMSDINLAPMSLGSLTEGVTPYEWTGAYQIFMNGGTFTKPHLYTKVVDVQGKTVLEADTSTSQAIGKDTAMILNQMLQNVVYTSTGTGGYASNLKNTKVAAKTGTSNDNKDLWFVAGTPEYVAGVWIGYEKIQRPLISHGTYAPVLTWTEVMKDIQPLAGKSGSFPESDQVVKLEYCTVTGYKAADTCPKATGYYKKSNQPRLCTPEDMAEALGGEVEYVEDEEGNLVPRVKEPEESSDSEGTGGLVEPGESSRDEDFGSFSSRSSREVPVFP